MREADALSRLPVQLKPRLLLYDSPLHLLHLPYLRLPRIEVLAGPAASLTPRPASPTTPKRAKRRSLGTTKGEESFVERALEIAVEQRALAGGSQSGASAPVMVLRIYDVSNAPSPPRSWPFVPLTSRRAQGSSLQQTFQLPAASIQLVAAEAASSADCSLDKTPSTGHFPLPSLPLIHLELEAGESLSLRPTSTLDLQRLLDLLGEEDETSDLLYEREMERRKSSAIAVFNPPLRPHARNSPACSRSRRRRLPLAPRPPFLSPTFHSCSTSFITGHLPLTPSARLAPPLAQRPSAGTTSPHLPEERNAGRALARAELRGRVVVARPRSECRNPPEQWQQVRYRAELPDAARTRDSHVRQPGRRLILLVRAPLAPPRLRVLLRPREHARALRAAQAGAAPRSAAASAEVGAAPALALQREQAWVGAWEVVGRAGGRKTTRAGRNKATERGEAAGRGWRGDVMGPASVTLPRSL